MKVLFATALDPVSYDHSRYRPLWPAYLAAYADRHLGAGRVVFRYCEGDLAREMGEFRPDLLAVSAVTQNFHHAQRLARLGKEAGIPVLLGGMHVTSLPGSLPREAAAGCIGEGEQTFLELLQAYLADGALLPSRLEGIRGIVYRDGDRLVTTPDRPPIAEMGGIPRPDRSLIGYRRREYLITARGCKYRCVFCSCSRYWGPIRYFSTDRVMEEVTDLVEHGVRIIRFNDDNFAGDLERLKEISQRVVEKGFHRRARFSCWARSNNVTPEAVAALRAMNVVAVVMGLESGSPETLRYLKGDVTVEDNLRAIRLLKEAGIQASGDFIIGAPRETREDILKTCQFIRTSGVDFVQLNVFIPLPGTPVWEEARRRNLVSDDMDWGRMAFQRFGCDAAGRATMSETMTGEELHRLYRMCRRAALRANLSALTRTPWLDELPGVMARIAREKLFQLGRKGARLFGKGSAHA